MFWKVYSEAIYVAEITPKSGEIDMILHFKYFISIALLLVLAAIPLWLTRMLKT